MMQPITLTAPDAYFAFWSSAISIGLCLASIITVGVVSANIFLYLLWRAATTHP